MFLLYLFLYARLETGRIMWLGMVGGHPHRFSHNNFSSAYQIFTKLGHMIPLWKGKNPIYFGVKGQGHCYYKYNFWQQGRFHMITSFVYWIFTMIALWKGKTSIYFGVIRSKVNVTITMNRIFNRLIIYRRVFCDAHISWLLRTAGFSDTLNATTWFGFCN
jgi:hypothetical protein